MKRWMLVAAAVVGALIVARQGQMQAEEQALWAEVTDPAPGPGR